MRKLTAPAAFCAISLAAIPATGHQDQPDWNPPRITSALVIGPTGPAQRAVILPNVIGADLVNGSWRAPQEGDGIEVGGGRTQEWQSVTVDPEGWIRNQGFGRGGNASIAVESDRDQVVLLAARGHSFVYVNGEQRTGDPYGTGFVELPISLTAGRNDLLIKGGRGDVRLQFKQARHGAALGADRTIPDVLAGDGGPYLGSVVVMNCSDQWLRDARLRVRTTPGAAEESIETAIDPIPPLGVVKAPFSFRVEDASDPLLGYDIALVSGGVVVDSTSGALHVRKPEDLRTITFRSGIDGSIQYYALRPALSAKDDEPGQLGLILSLHGAGVEGAGQAAAYGAKSWGNLVAATNRRPFGFDWEDWGRLDAMEVLDRATTLLHPDPRRIYLTGHSMGGHGTWQVGAHFPGRFAAIAPSAGWISFWSYSGAAAYDGATPVENILRRAASPSDTLALKDNYLQHGVYILHGDGDDNVPVAQARQMRKTLGEFHPDFAYYERPGAGHWWGNECVDWPPLMAYLRSHARPAAVSRVNFTTSSPGVSAECDWVTIETQVTQLQPSSVDLRLIIAGPKTDATAAGQPTATVRGTVTNVSVLSLDVPALAELAPKGDGSARTLGFDLDGQTLPAIDLAASPGRMFLSRDGDSWSITVHPPASDKNPRRGGLFKTAFTNSVVLVVGTIGTPEENKWALIKARYDAETFWYRGNGLLRVVTDTQAKTDPSLRGPNLVLYGNADTNSAWADLLGDSPVQVFRGRVRVGDRQFEGDDLACLVIRPHPGNDQACIGAVAATGMIGCRLAGQVPYFMSGVGLPDWVVIGAEAMKEGVRGVRGAGFFDNQWRLSEQDSGWLAP